VHVCSFTCILYFISIRASSYLHITVLRSVSLRSCEASGLRKVTEATGCNIIKQEVPLTKQHREDQGGISKQAPSPTLPHEAPFPHITTRGSVPQHYHTRLRSPTLPHEAPFPHITTRGSVPPHYHTRFRSPTLPHEAPFPHITTRGSVPPHYHTRLRSPTLPHEASFPHITTRGSVSNHNLQQAEGKAAEPQAPVKLQREFCFTWKPIEGKKSIKTAQFSSVFRFNGIVSTLFGLAETSRWGVPLPKDQSSGRAPGSNRFLPVGGSRFGRQEKRRRKRSGASGSSVRSTEWNAEVGLLDRVQYVRCQAQESAGVYPWRIFAAGQTCEQSAADMPETKEDMENRNEEIGDKEASQAPLPQTKRSGKSLTKSKRCSLCNAKLSETYKKDLCSSCIKKIVREEQPSMLSEMRNIIWEEVQNSLASMSQREVYSPGPARKRPRKDPEQEVQDGSSEAESEYRGSDQEEGELPVEEQEGKRYYFPVEETEELVQAVRRTMQVKEDPQPRSRQDQMFGGLTYQERTVFPVSEHIRKMISQEWKDAERRLVMSREFKNRLPFDSEEIKTWEEIPKVDVPLAKVAKKTSIPFEDSSSLKDAMDRKADILLRRAWETSAALIKTNIAATSVARSMFLWMEQLEEHLINKTSRADIIASLPIIKSATAFMADTSAES
ncbi:unnamed protein product, partial [Ranitomeya imitator]